MTAKKIYDKLLGLAQSRMVITEKKRFQEQVQPMDSWIRLDEPQGQGSFLGLTGRSATGVQETAL